MDSPLTGYRNAPVNLLQIETNLFKLFIKGRPYHPTVETLQLHRQEEEVWSDAHFHVEVPSSKVEVSSVQIFSRQTLSLQAWDHGDQADFSKRKTINSLLKRSRICRSSSFMRIFTFGRL